MRQYNEVLLELKDAGIIPCKAGNNFLDISQENEALRSLLEPFFRLGQDFIERQDMGFSFNKPRLYFSDNNTLNAVARVSGEYLLIEIFKGAFTWMQDFYLTKGDKFEHESIQIFKKITAIRGVTPPMMLLQLTSLFFLYHESGHLVQRSGQMMEEEDYFEFIQNQCTGGMVPIRHIRELDADWFASHHVAMHIKEFSEVDTPNGVQVDRNIVFNLASLGLAGLYMYFISRSEKQPDIYYEEKCHPHPSVRLCYVAEFFLDNLQGNIEHQIDKKAILQNAIVISVLLMDNEEQNIVTQYSNILYNEIDEIEVYIHTIMNNAEQYPYTCTKLLKKN